MGKVTFLSLPPTCWKELFNCVCLAMWSGAPSSFSACASLLVQRVSASYHGPWLLCVCGNSCCHIFIEEPWAALVSSSQGASLVTADCGRSWVSRSLHGSRSLIWPGPGPGCTELCLCFLSSQGPVPTKSVALECRGRSRKKKHQGNAGAGIRRGRRLVMRSELCVLGRLIRWLSLIRGWPGPVQGDNRCPQEHNGRGTTSSHAHRGRKPPLDRGDILTAVIFPSFAAARWQRGFRSLSKQSEEVKLQKKIKMGNHWIAAFPSCLCMAHALLTYRHRSVQSVSDTSREWVLLH